MRGLRRTRWRRYLGHLLAVLALAVVGIAVGVGIAAKQNFVWPWQDFYEVKAEFRTAQAVAPGQGQMVMIAGVEVGDVESVDLNDGVAVVTVRIQNRYAPIYRNARMTLRPRTLGQDINIALDPGTPAAGKLPDGGTLPVSQTMPNVNTDELLSTFDADTRDYLRMLIGGLGEGVRGNAGALRRMLAATEPTVSQSRRVSAALAARRHEIAHLVHNLNRVNSALARHQQDISTAIDASGATLGAVAREDRSLRAALRLLPGTLARADSALRHGGEFARELGPTAAALRPTVRELRPALLATEPVAREGAPVLRRKVRPLVRAALPVARDLEPAARDVRATLPHLRAVIPRVNKIANLLTYDPPGAQRGYLYYLPWFAHNFNSVFSGEDAHGAFARGIVVFSCSDLETLLAVVQTIPQLHLDLPPLNTLPTCGGSP